MCGICGLLGRDAPDPGLVERMNEAIVHRGPDHGAVAAHGRCVLGYRRLSIIDLQTGDQPAWVLLEDGHRVLELPTTHSFGAVARALARRLPPVVHVHFHDYELLDAKRRTALEVVLRVLARRRRPTELGALGADREVAWADVCAA